MLVLRLESTLLASLTSTHLFGFADSQQAAIGERTLERESISCGGLIDTVVIMCEDKTSTGAVDGEQGGQDASKTPSSPPHDSLDDRSPFGTDSGHASPVSTPEALTPHEERSATPPTGMAMVQTDAETAATMSATEELVSYANDAVYRLKIVAPGSEPFELQVVLEEKLLGRTAPVNHSLYIRIRINWHRFGHKRHFEK